MFNRRSFIRCASILTVAAWSSISAFPWAQKTYGHVRKDMIADDFRGCLRGSHADFSDQTLKVDLDRHFVTFGYPDREAANKEAGRYNISFPDVVAKDYVNGEYRAVYDYKLRQLNFAVFEYLEPSGLDTSPIPKTYGPPVAWIKYGVPRAERMDGIASMKMRYILICAGQNGLDLK